MHAKRKLAFAAVVMTPLYGTCFASSLHDDVEYFEHLTDRHAAETLEETRVCLREGARSFLGGGADDRALIANRIAKDCGEDLAQIIQQNGRTRQRAYEIIRVLAHQEIARQMFHSGQDSSDEGWWVVVGSFTESNSGRPEYLKMNALAAQCGLKIFNDTSAKFFGFRPGYNVFVMGPYRSKEQANTTQLLAKSCFPASYIKYGRYAGE